MFYFVVLFQVMFYFVVLFQVMFYSVVLFQVVLFCSSISGNEKFVFWENYFDIPGFLVCAQVVDYLDKKVIL